MNFQLTMQTYLINCLIVSCDKLDEYKKRAMPILMLHSGIGRDSDEKTSKKPIKLLIVKQMLIRHTLDSIWFIRDLWKYVQYNLRIVGWVILLVWLKTLTLAMITTFNIALQYICEYVQYYLATFLVRFQTNVTMQFNSSKKENKLCPIFLRRFEIFMPVSDVSTVPFIPDNTKWKRNSSQCQQNSKKNCSSFDKIKLLLNA